MPDVYDTNAAPAYPIPSQPSRPSTSPSPLAKTSHALPHNSVPAWDMSQTMKLAGGPGLDKVIAMAGLPVASDRAGGDGRRTGLKRKAGEVTEDFALLTTRMSSMRYAADFLSTVGNVSLRDYDLKSFISKPMVP